MVQLILDTQGANITLPESQNDGYSVQTESLNVEVEMISGRVVREVRGDVWVIKYQYGYFDDEMKNKVIAVCEKGKRQPIRCAFLPQESDGALTYSDFWVTDFQRPKFAWSRPVLDWAQYVPKPIWGDFRLELREVRPHD